MPQTRKPDLPLPKPLFCPKCGKPMRIAESKPSAHYINLAERTYQCDCGETADCIARKQ